MSNLLSIKLNKSNVDDDEEFYTKRAIEKSLKTQGKLDSFNQPDQDCSIFTISKTSIETSAYFSLKSELETKSQVSLFTEDCDYLDDRTSVLFNDSILSWNCELESHDLLSIDSGFSSSFVSSSTANIIECPVSPIQPSDFVFDQILRDILSQTKSDTFGFVSGLDLLSTIPVILKSAFVSWSKTSLRRLRHTVLNRLIRAKPKMFLEYELNHETIVIESTVVPSIPTNKVTLFSLFQSLNSFSFEEYRSNLIYKFYCYHSFNFC